MPQYTGEHGRSEGAAVALLARGNQGPSCKVEDRPDWLSWMNELDGGQDFNARLEGSALFARMVRPS